MKTTNLAPQKTKRSRGKIAVAAMLGLIALSAACAPAPDPAPVPVTVPVTVPASCANGRASCVLGDIGPGGGKVFYINGVTRYEMAPNTWSGGAVDPQAPWCSDTTHSVVAAASFAIGAGEANTAAMLTNASPFVACTSGAGYQANAYRGGGQSDWFLPSLLEAAAMCQYSRNPSAPAAGLPCAPGSPDATFASSAYGFSTTAGYWTSSDVLPLWAAAFNFNSGNDGTAGKSGSGIAIRPIRSF